jgi:hypothetical protein
MYVTTYSIHSGYRCREQKRSKFTMLNGYLGTFVEKGWNKPLSLAGFSFYKLFGC